MSSAFQGINDSTTGLVALSVGTGPLPASDTFSQPSEAGFSLSGETLTIAAGTTTNDSVVMTEGGIAKAFSGDFTFTAQLDELTTCFGIRGLQVNSQPTFQPASSAVASLFIYLQGGIPRATAEGTALVSTTVGTLYTGVLKIQAEGSLLGLYIDDNLVVIGSRPAGALYLQLFGVYNGPSFAFNVATTLRNIAAAGAFSSEGFRGMFVAPAAARPFPIYASTGQAVASASGGLTFDADGRLRITSAIPATPANLSGGLIADAATEALVVSETGASVWHQGVSLTNEGYLGVTFDTPIVVENDFADAEYGGGYN